LQRLKRYLDLWLHREKEYRQLMLQEVKQDPVLLQHGGKAITNEVDAMGFKWEWNGRSSKHIPFDWIGP
jgi:hypothetical protein